MLASTAWVGGLWGIGYLAVPVLFQTLPDKMLAGILAGKMFALISYLGIVCALYLISYQLGTCGRQALRQTSFRLVAIMLALTLILQFGIQPVMADLKAQAFPADIMHTVLAERFRMLHGLSSTLYLAQSLLGAMLILKAERT